MTDGNLLGLDIMISLFPTVARISNELIQYFMDKDNLGKTF